MPDFDRGVNFYDEVRRFEIDLIRRALEQTGGHQSRAARLLGMNATTLNSKIKTYNIQLRPNHDDAAVVCEASLYQAGHARAAYDRIRRNSKQTDFKKCNQEGDVLSTHGRKRERHSGS
ncbi:MAG: helix-turn-helix domain-containing protein [Pyrinomonadaceae bacterium]